MAGSDEKISIKTLQQLYEEHEATLEHASGPWHWVVCSCGWNSDVDRHDRLPGIRSAHRGCWHRGAPRLKIG
jgi:hypothetical protein